MNLFDLSFLANMDDSATKNTFDTVPMGIINDGFGNYFLQALAMKNEELALAVDEMIKNGDFPMIENNNE